MNYIYRFLVFSFVWMVCCFGFSSEAALNHQEAAFIERHLVSNDQKMILDSIFANLDKTILDLFSGKNVQVFKSDILKLLKESDFKLYTFHYRPLDHFDTDGRTARLVARHKKIPGYFLKIGFDTVEKRKNLSRVMYADLINEAIDTLNLTKISKVEKKIYHRIGCPEDLIDFNYIVVVPKISGHRIKAELVETGTKKRKNSKILFPDDAYKAEYLALKALVGYSDEYRGNFKITNDGKLYIIDTEADHTLLPKMIFETLNVID